MKAKARIRDPISGRRKTLGDRGETLAINELERRGYRIVDKNVRPLPGMARGEIDIVAWDDGTLVFVEVKTRRADRAPSGTPAEALTRAKRRQLLGLAEAYLALHELDDVPCRFDVVAITTYPHGRSEVELIQGAFDGGDA